MAGPVNARPQHHHGTSASPGRAVGPAHCAESAAARVVDPVTDDARAALRAAVALAVAELRGLSDRADVCSAGVLDFQIEMLLDEEILVPALNRIAQGEGAALAWAGAMTAYIDAFSNDGSDDDAFAARVADLLDLRQRVLDALAGRPSAGFPAGSIYVGPDMPPSVFLAHDWSAGGGIALNAGSVIGHVALLARARNVPMVIGLGELAATDGQTILVDGDNGAVQLDPPEAVSLTPAAPARPAPAERQAPASGGGARVKLCVNLNTLADLDAFDPERVDGVGLVRTEFMFLSPAEALNEERHFAVYRRIVASLGGRPVAIRMLDLGGDKTLPGIAEGGPASLLGERGVRLLLAHPELARVQARALLRAGVLGPVSVLLPMVTLPDELTAMERLFAEEETRLARLGIPVRRPPLGIMVEVPSTALTLDLFGEASFFSVGTNDLMQYLSAAARDNPAVAHLNARSEVALFRLLDQVSAAARLLGKPVSVCGDIAGQPRGLARLVAAGFHEVSVTPGRLGAVQAQLREVAAVAGLTES
ncbi:putative PEP-binding protein [Ancylobacter pratisalsi]|uniref:Phosphoenolpyruvate--protein phosphotransferase n=1 Tax=Ancylobacter pratisalsi TaxID=1745854 RepID=A0A6P1YG44_9HYPH|nr:putative PEP-binding protein [Ancylobacter pratisalsi]QIB32267.1 phosphoenolpyruvate--protein phosphotransferase [Ancylobacter pratisalsi]